MQVCSDAYDPKKVTAARMPVGPTFTLGSLAVDGAIHGQPTARIAFAEAKNAHELAMGSIRNATSSDQIDDIERAGKAKLEAAVRVCTDPDELRNLKWRLWQLTQKATGLRAGILRSTEDPSGTAAPSRGPNVLDEPRRTDELADIASQSPKTILQKLDAAKTISEVDDILASGDNAARIATRNINMSGHARRNIESRNNLIRRKARNVRHSLHRSADSSQLSDYSRGVVQRYTGISHLVLNSSLWSGTIDEVEEIAGFSHDLSAALRQLPDYTGTVLRGSDPNRPQETYHVERYIPGSVVVENGYSSSSRDPEEEFNGKILWIIDSKHGKDISKLSLAKSEAEVLFDRFSRFEVLSRNYDFETQRWQIYMAEIE